MARPRKKPHELLAESLKAVHAVATDGIVRSSDLDRVHRERLIKAGSLTEIIRGWYLFTAPGSNGGSTAWFGGFWAFINHYLTDRFGRDGYCLAAESSLGLHSGDTVVPDQLIILTKKPSNTVVELLYGTSLLLRKDAANFPSELDSFHGVNIMMLSEALCRISSYYYQRFPNNVEIVLKLSNLAVSELSANLLKSGQIASGERLIGALYHLRETSRAGQIRADLEAVGYEIKEVNPFESYVARLGEGKIASPYATRIRLMWNSMREGVLQFAPDVPDVKRNEEHTIEMVLESHRDDAYNSLSIEGYQVTEDLIEKIESGNWDPEGNLSDKDQVDAMAAKGYFQTFKVVLESIKKVFAGANPGGVVKIDLQTWYRELFTPMLKANIFPAERIVGYRTGSVFIKGSRHVPLPRTAILDSMDVLFEMMIAEENPFVRAVLGHFLFVYIHPYFDGNGRIGRFIFNYLLITGDLDWTVIRNSERERYMSTLEVASTKGNIVPFAEFIRSEYNYWQKVRSERK